MEFMIGYAGAFAKIVAVGLAIIAALWGLAHVYLRFYNRRREPAGDDGD